LSESRAIPIIRALLKEEALIYAFDPQAMAVSKEIFGNRVYYAINFLPPLFTEQSGFLIER